MSDAMLAEVELREAVGEIVRVLVAAIRKRRPAAVNSNLCCCRRRRIAAEHPQRESQRESRALEIGPHVFVLRRFVTVAATMCAARDDNRWCPFQKGLGLIRLREARARSAAR